MRTFNVTVNLQETVWGICSKISNLDTKVSDKIEELKVGAVDFTERSGFAEWVNLPPEGESFEEKTLSLSQAAMFALAGWDEDYDDSVIGFICSEIMKDRV